MTNKELRAKYGDFTKTDNYTYPDHFFSPWDDFTLHIPNWNSFLIRFEGQDGLRFLELGTAQGRASVWLLENILSGPSSVLDTVDMTTTSRVTNEKVKAKLDGQELDIDCIQNLQPYLDSGKCKFHQQTTQSFLTKADPNVYDFIYVDASHEPVDVLRDAMGSFDTLKPNGLMLFDDYGWKDCHHGIDAFLHAYYKKINIHVKGYQVLVEKL